MNDVYYRNRELYNLEWDINLGDGYIVSICKFTKTIALHKIIQSGSVSNDILIYSGSGELIHTINWNNHLNGRILDLQWTEDEKLIVLLQNGTLRVYYNFQGDFNEYEIGFNFNLIGVKNCLIIRSVIFILLNDFKIVYLDLDDKISVHSRLFRDLNKDLKLFESQLKLVPEPQLEPELELELHSELQTEGETRLQSKQPNGSALNGNGSKANDVRYSINYFHCWEIIQINSSNKFEIILSLNKSVLKVSKYGKIMIVSGDGPFNQMAISENSKFLTLFNSKDSHLYFLTSTFDKKLFQTKLDSIPLQLKWCGSDAVVAAYKDHLKLIGPGGNLIFYLNNNNNSEFLINSEVDGLTVLTNNSLEFLSKIPVETVECFKIGSTSKASILIDSIDKLNLHSPKANENLLIIGSEKNLETSINTCLISSLEEFDPYWQKKLLKASSFGKSSIEFKYKNFKFTDVFIKNCETLRILNLFRSINIGIFLTFNQFNYLGIEKLLKLLVKRQKYYLAFKLSNFLKLSVNLIFIDWACSKIKFNLNLNDEDLSKIIITKFHLINNSNGSNNNNLSNTLKKTSPVNNTNTNYSSDYISFEKISRVAFQEGRLNLAKILINFESIFSKQIPLLLTMEEHELAINKACDSKDVDLILETLLILKNSLSLPKFFKLMNNIKLSSEIFEYFFQNNFKLIYDYYNQEDRLIDISNIEVKNELNQSSFDYNKNLKIFENALNSYGLVSKNSIEHKQIEKQIELIKLQNEYTEEFNIEFNGLSIIKTLEKLILLNQSNKINKFCKKFNINDKKFYFIKLNYLFGQEKYEEIYEWSITKKPIIGYEPIFKKFINKKDQTKLSLFYLDKCQNFSFDEKITYLIKLKQFKKAIDECFNKKNSSKLNEIKSIIINENPSLVNEIDSKIELLNSSSSTTSRFF